MAKYDVAVVGAGMAGLAAAAVLAAAKRRVIVFDHDDRPGGLMAVRDFEGMRFPSGPPAAYGFERGGALHRLSLALGMPAVHSPGPSLYQVALPDRRITVSSEASETLDELRREFPAEIDRAARMYRDARSLRERAATSGVTAFLIRRRSAGAFLSGYAFSRELTAFFTVQSRYFFGQAAAALPLADLLLLTGGAPPLLRDGAQEVADRLRAAIETAGGTCRFSAPWPELFLRNGRTAFLRTGDETVDARSVLLNLPAADDETTLFLSVRGRAIPVGMASLVLSAADYERPHDILALASARSRRASSSGEDSVPVTATLLPGSGPHETSRERVIDHVRRLMPFLDDFVTASHVNDRAARYVPVPPELTLPKAEAGTEGLLMRLRPAANVFLLPDSAAPLVGAAAAGQRAARKIA